MDFKELSEKEKTLVYALESIFINNNYISRRSFVRVLGFLINKYKKKNYSVE